MERQLLVRSLFVLVYSLEYLGFSEKIPSSDLFPSTLSIHSAERTIDIALGKDKDPTYYI